MAAFMAGVLTTVVALGGVALAVAAVQLRGRCGAHRRPRRGGPLLMPPTQRWRVAR